MASKMTTTTTSTSATTSAPPPLPPPPRFHSIDFEVFGKVQGVYFRQHVTDKADEINARGSSPPNENGGDDSKKEKRLVVVGWVRNTKQGSVEGVAQGDPQAVAELERFVTRVGSPASRIDRFEVKNRREIDTLEYEVFERRY